MIGTIKIDDQIGAYQTKDGQTKGVTLLGILTQFKALPQGTRIVNVEIASPGGLVDEGDAIYEYIKSEKKNYVINTVQVGDIASIATKLFLVGDTRSADPKFDFMIHNPWTDPGAGDSRHQAEVLEGLLQSESALRKFYSKELNITEEGLAPLMDRETFMTGEQLLSLGFATQIKRENVFAMAEKGKKEPTLTERISALYKKATGKDIKAEGAKALDVALADGKTVLSIAAEDEASMVGAAATIDGNPAPDSDYTAAPGEDGVSDVITVKDGMVAAVTEGKTSAAGPDRIAVLEKNVSQLTEAVSALVEASKASATVAIEARAKALEESFEGKIVALKSEIGTVHNPKKAATVYADSVKKETEGHKTITQVLAEKAEARKKQLYK